MLVLNLPVGCSLNVIVSSVVPQLTAVMNLSLWSHRRRKEREEAEEYRL